MALYKQPYGNRMEKRAALRKEGIFAKIKAKRDANRAEKNTKEAMGHDVKEENKISNKKLADEVFEIEKKTTIPESAKLTVETSNSGVSPEAQKIKDAAGMSGPTGFVESNNPNSGNHDSFMKPVYGGSAQSHNDITSQGDRDQSGSVEGKVQAFEGKTTNIGFSTGTIGKVGDKDGANASFEANARFGPTSVRSTPEYASTINNIGIGPGANNTQIKYKMPGTGTFNQKGFGANVDAGFKVSNNILSAKFGGGYSSLNPKGSRGYGFVEGGIKGNLLNLNKIKDKNFYKAGNTNLSIPFSVTGRASAGGPKMPNSWLPMNSLNKNSGFKGSIGLNISNVAKNRSVEAGIQKDYQNSSVNPYLKASFAIGKDKSTKKNE